MLRLFDTFDFDIFVFEPSTKHYIVIVIHVPYKISTRYLIKKLAMWLFEIEPFFSDSSNRRLK